MYPILVAALPATVENIPVGMPNGYTYRIPSAPPPPRSQSKQVFVQGFGQRFAPGFQPSPEFIYPLAAPAPITSDFGWRIHPVYGDRRFHAGIDFGAPMGTPVLAASAARVKSAENQGGYGLAVVLEHWDGTTNTMYGHLSEILVGVGQMVQPGQVIGKVGSTGRSTGPHLHFELRRWEAGDWVAVDPGQIMQRALGDRKIAQQ